MGNQRKIYGAGAINIDEPRSNFPFSLHQNLPEKHGSSNVLYQYVTPWALFTYGMMVHWQPRMNVEKETKKRRIGARCNLRTRGKVSIYLDNCKEGNIDLCSSNGLSKYHLFVIFGVEILLPFSLRKCWSHLSLVLMIGSATKPHCHNNHRNQEI